MVAKRGESLHPCSDSFESHKRLGWKKNCETSGWFGKGCHSVTFPVPYFLVATLKLNNVWRCHWGLSSISFQIIVGKKVFLRNHFGKVAFHLSLFLPFSRKNFLQNQSLQRAILKHFFPQSFFFSHSLSTSQISPVERGSGRWKEKKWEWKESGFECQCQMHKNCANVANFLLSNSGVMICVGLEDRKTQTRKGGWFIKIYELKLSKAGFS